MSDPVSDRLESFQENDLTVKVCRLLLEAIPKAPSFVYYRDLKGAMKRIGAEEPVEVPVSVLEEVKSERVARTLWVTDKLDIADAALASYTGVSNILAWVAGGKPGRHVFESDRQQAIDAVLKLLGVSYVANKLFEGSVRGKIKRLVALPAGQEMVLYLCLAEIALPFFDNVVAGGWGFASKHLESAMTEGEAKFGQVTGERATSELKETMGGMKGLLGETMASVRGHLGTVAGKLNSAMPTILNVTDSVSGVMATTLDALPVWRFLGARLAAEASAFRAVGTAVPEGAAESTFEVSL